MRTVDNDFSDLCGVSVTVGGSAHIAAFVSWGDTVESQIVAADVDGAVEGSVVKLKIADKTLETHCGSCAPFSPCQ